MFREVYNMTIIEKLDIMKIPRTHFCTIPDSLNTERFTSVVDKTYFHWFTIAIFVFPPTTSGSACISIDSYSISVFWYLLQYWQILFNLKSFKTSCVTFTLITEIIHNFVSFLIQRATLYSQITLLIIFISSNYMTTGKKEIWSHTIILPMWWSRWKTWDHFREKKPYRNFSPGLPVFRPIVTANWKSKERSSPGKCRGISYFVKVRMITYLHFIQFSMSQMKERG